MFHFGCVGERRSAPETLQACFARTTSRGPDMSRFVEIPCGYLGFQRLAIMGLDERGMQPFRLDGDYVVCNGELYGFRPLRERLKEKYAFVSESDCEILLPLYREYGLEMFRALDAEFALVHLRRARKTASSPPATPSASARSITGRSRAAAWPLPASRRTSWGCAKRSCPSRPAATGRTAGSSATPTPRTWISSPWWTRRPPAPGCTTC